jgi:NAD(P)-dependent dehydrogenase (short-subunit alcohol dehydrogenase family)
MLGEAGATVYCTGRGSRAAPSAAGHYAGRPETVEETAELVSAAGGVGIPRRVDHAVEGEVAALVDHIRREHGRLDVLVNVLGGPEANDQRPFWELPVDAGREMVDRWLWPHVLTCRAVVPLMVERRSGLVVEIIEGETLDYRGRLYFDLAVTALKRLMYGLAEELAPHGVTALAVAPGFMRTEATWRRVAEESAEARGFGFAGSETPCYVGRAIAALAADPELGRRSGGLYCSWELAEEYGFTDVDGARPHWGRYLAEHFPTLVPGITRTGRRWELTESRTT